MNKKLYNSLKFSMLAVEKTVKIIFSIMYNFAAKFAKILETCKKFSTNLVNDFGNAPAGVWFQNSQTLRSLPCP